MTHLTYTPDGSSVMFAFKYDSGMVNALKAQIPPTHRKWDQATKTWLISPSYIATACQLAQTYLHENVTPPAPRQTTQQDIIQEIITMRYLGAARDRGQEFRIAMGHDGKDWRFIFPEPTLEKWFGITSHDPALMHTLYSVLGCAPQAAGTDIKRAFRQAAKQWHPDVCHEPNATETFRRLNEAYQILSDPAKRARYDAGLALEASTRSMKTKDISFAASYEDNWRPPLRCGYLLVKGRPQVGRLLVEEILQWTDIVDGAGRTLVTSWQFGNDMYTEQWV